MSLKPGEYSVAELARALNVSTPTARDEVSRFKLEPKEVFRGGKNCAGMIITDENIIAIAEKYPFILESESEERTEALQSHSQPFQTIENSVLNRLQNENQELSNRCEQLSNSFNVLETSFKGLETERNDLLQKVRKVEDDKAIVESQLEIERKAWFEERVKFDDKLHAVHALLDQERHALSEERAALKHERAEREGFLREIGDLKEAVGIARGEAGKLAGIIEQMELRLKDKGLTYDAFLQLKQNCDQMQESYGTTVNAIKTAWQADVERMKATNEADRRTLEAENRTNKEVSKMTNDLSRLIQETVGGAAHQITNTIHKLEDSIPSHGVTHVEETTVTHRSIKFFGHEIGMPVIRKLPKRWNEPTFNQVFQTPPKRLQSPKKVSFDLLNG